MEKQTPQTRAKARAAESLVERLLYCAAVLHVGGFMTDAERLKVHQRMMKWKAKAEGKPGSP